MEAAKPILSTPNINEDLEINEMIEPKSFEIEINNKKCKFEIAKSKNNKGIIFKVSFISALEYYFLFISEDELYNLNPFFKLYQNLNEIFTLLLDTINDKNYSVSFQDTFVILVFKFSLLTFF